MMALPIVDSSDSLDIIHDSFQNVKPFSQ